MSRLFLLSEKDLLSTDHFPVQAVFNCCDTKDFFKIVVNNISKGCGFGVDCGDCEFPGDLDEYDIATGRMFEGVSLLLYNWGDVTLDYETFYYYLKLVCDRYLKTHKKEKKEIYNALKEYCKRFNVDLGNLN